MPVALSLVGRARRARSRKPYELACDEKMGQHSDDFRHEFLGVSVRASNG